MIYKGQVIWVKLEGKGSEQRGERPCIVIQNDMGNKFSPTTIVVPLTSRIPKKMLPTHLYISEGELGNKLKDSIVLCEQIRTIDKSRIVSKGSVLKGEVMKKLQEKVLISLDFMLNTV